MAIYHLSVKPVQRSKGRSSTAAAAYRAGCVIEDERTGLSHDYTKKKGIEHTEIITPDGVNVPDRQTLWNMAEKAERRKDGCTAREYEVNLPYELTKEQRIALAQDFSKQLAELNGNAVDLCMHEPDQRNPKNNTTGSDPRNYHAHILTTTRKITNDGLTDKCDIEKSGRKRKDDLANIRKLWETTCNRHLEMANVDARIDCRSHAERGLNVKPTIKMGWKASQAERRGIATRKGDINRQIRSDNEVIHGLELEIKVLERRRDAQNALDAPSVSQSMLEKLRAKKEAQNAPQTQIERPSGVSASQSMLEKLRAKKEAQNAPPTPDPSPPKEPKQSTPKPEPPSPSSPSFRM